MAIELDAWYFRAPQAIVDAANTVLDALDNIGME